MKTSRIEWFGAKLREEALRIWPRYKEYYEERNVVNLQQ